MKSGVVNEASQVNRIQHNLGMTINFPLPCLQPSVHLYFFQSGAVLSKLSLSRLDLMRTSPFLFFFNTMSTTLKVAIRWVGFIESSEKFPFFKENNYSWFRSRSMQQQCLCGIITMQRNYFTATIGSFTPSECGIRAGIISGVEHIVLERSKVSGLNQCFLSAATLKG